MSLDEKYIQEAADRIMIQDLLGRYAFAADYGKGDPESWAALFIDDGRFEVPEISLVVAGRAALIKFIEGLHRTVPGLHHVMSNFVIDIDGDRARGKCELNEFMLRPEAIYNNLHGWYEDDYVRVDGRWYIKVRRVHLPDDTRSVASSGRVGEYFKDFFDMCKEFNES
ncbi:MAG: nuclear transport factor 2 family protein [Gammaproteobacteria bacterium]|nr:nuclear transport factor 2 family protein [Gammaproteobacteria bacterium]